MEQTAFQALPKGTLVNKKYKVLSFVSRGGQAEIYRVTMLATGETAALKLVRASSDEGTKEILRLRQEFAILKKLEGLEPFLRAYDFQMGKTMAYMVLEWIEAPNGAEYIKRRGELNFKTWLWLARAITQAVGECHARYILHRDIKPENILIDASRVKLIDFGISRAENQSGRNTSQQGTALYVPPEQIAEGLVTASGEIYSLGVTLYEFLTACPPFPENYPEGIMKCKLQGRISPASLNNPDVPPWVDDFFTALLQPRKELRPQGTKEVLALLSSECERELHAGVQLARQCGNCGQALWKELPFCTHCGKAFQLEVERGRFGVMVEKVADSAKFAHFVGEVTDYTPSVWRSCLYESMYPRVLLYGLSECAAAFAAETFSNRNSTVRAVRKPVWDMLKAARLNNLQKHSAVVTLFIFFIAIFIFCKAIVLSGKHRAHIVSYK